VRGVSVEGCVQVVLVGSVTQLHAFEQLVLISVLPAAAVSVGSQSSPENIPFSTEPGLTLPGQRMMAGTRKPPSKVVPLVALNGVKPPNGSGRAARFC
jgi:hypothetical protein